MATKTDGSQIQNEIRRMVDLIGWVPRCYQPFLMGNPEIINSLKESSIYDAHNPRIPFLPVGDIPVEEGKSDLFLRFFHKEDIPAHWYGHGGVVL